MPTDEERYKTCCGDGDSTNPVYSGIHHDPDAKKNIHDKFVKGFDKLADYRPSSATVENYHWYKRYLEVAKTYAGFSKDPSTTTGAVVVDSGRRIVCAAFNGIPQKLKDTDERLNNRELKLKYILHAEESALIMSKSDLINCTIFVHPLPPCMRCALLIIQSGITKVVAPKLSGGLLERWGDSVNVSRELFKEANIEFIEI